MKIRVLFSLASVCALLVFSPNAARAFDIPSYDYGNDETMPAVVVQLFTDLADIPAGSAATDAQHALLVADLDALTAGVFTPDPADLDQLATDLATAATNNLFFDNVIEYLADDFIGDPDDPSTDPDGWMGDIQDDVASLIDPPTTFTGDPGTDPTLVNTGIYEFGVAHVAPVNGTSNRITIQLQSQGIPVGLLENYYGHVQLATHSTVGGATVNTLRVNTNGLPPSNPYSVSITRQSDGASMTIGKLTVHSGSGAVALSASHDLLPMTPVPKAEFFTYGRAIFGGSNPDKSLPAGFNATNVATVTVTDAQGIVRLTGSFNDQTALLNQVQALSLRLNGTSIAPAPAPYANVSARYQLTTNTLAKRFRLSARHLPASVPVTLMADGVSVGQFTTTASGRLVVVEGFTPRTTNRAGVLRPYNILPNSPDLSAAKSFSLTDAQGNILLDGSLGN